MSIGRPWTCVVSPAVGDEFGGLWLTFMIQKLNTVIAGILSLAGSRLNQCPWSPRSAELTSLSYSPFVIHVCLSLADPPGPEAVL